MFKPFIAVSFLLAATTGLAQGSNLSFLNQSVLMHIPKAQVSEFSAEVGRVLNEVADGQRATWRSKPASSRRQPVDVTFMPRQTTQTSKGQTCRYLAADVAEGAAREQWGFWFCKQESGACASAM